MPSFGEYLEAINITWGGFIYVASVILATGAVFGGIAALFLGCERVASRWGAWWNLLYVPSVIIATAFIVIFLSWVGIVVSRYV